MINDYHRTDENTFRNAEHESTAADSEKKKQAAGRCVDALCAEIPLVGFHMSVFILIVRAAYDEEDGDFVFTRASKRTKSAPTDPEPVPPPAPAQPPKKSRKTKERDEETSLSVKKTRGRKMSFSTPKMENDSTNAPKRRKSTRSSIGKDHNGESSTHPAGMESTDYDSIDLVGVSVSEEPSKSMVSTNQQSTMIALPFSDTPVINRNKELRKKGAGGRRSSLGMRGRRASSLIDNGHSAIPHREVDTKDFYKHIEAGGLSEPRMMKQLLTWTGERALGERPSHGDPDSAAALAGKHHLLPSVSRLLTISARVITEALLKDFSNKSEFSNWFDREESVPAPTKVVKKPNPRNLEIEENLVGLETRIKKYDFNQCSSRTIR